MFVSNLRRVAQQDESAPKHGDRRQLADRYLAAEPGIGWPFFLL
jgi:hypothetical protein